VTAIVAGSLAPLISIALLRAFDTWYAVAGYVFVAAVISVLGVLLPTETRNCDLAADETRYQI
jgi:hypothetical protein